MYPLSTRCAHPVSQEHAIWQKLATHEHDDRVSPSLVQRARDEDFGVRKRYTSASIPPESWVFQSAGVGDLEGEQEEGADDAAHEEFCTDGAEDWLADAELDDGM